MQREGHAEGRAGEVKETEHLTPKPEEAEGWRGRWQYSCQGDLSAGPYRQSQTSVPDSRSLWRTVRVLPPSELGLPLPLASPCNSALTWHLAFSARLVRPNLWGCGPGGHSQKFPLAEDPPPRSHPSVPPVCRLLDPCPGPTAAPQHLGCQGPLKLHSGNKTRTSMLLRNSDSLYLGRRKCQKEAAGCQGNLREEA